MTVAAWRAVGACVGLLPVMLVVASGAVGQEPAAVREARDRVLRDSRYETELVVAERDPISTRDASPRASDTSLGGSRGWSSWVAGVVLLLMLAILLVVGWVVLLRERRASVPRRQDRSAEHRPVALAARSDPQPLLTLAEVEQYVLRGEFERAVSGLLHLCLRSVEKSTGRVARAHETGRRILTWSALDTGMRAGLTLLVAAVERSRFAGLSLCEDDYKRCRIACAPLLGEATS